MKYLLLIIVYASLAVAVLGVIIDTLPYFTSKCILYGYAKPAGGLSMSNGYSEIPTCLQFEKK